MNCAAIRNVLIAVAGIVAAFGSVALAQTPTGRARRLGRISI